MNYSFKVTTAGRALLAELLATGKELEITRAAVGSGKVSAEQNLADMTDLVKFEAEATIAQRSHRDNILFLTVQYSSNSTPGKGAFYIGEFIIQAKQPSTGENVTLIYATLGDYIQPVNAYSETAAPDIRSYPIATVISDEISVNITAPVGLITYDDLKSAVDQWGDDYVAHLEQELEEIREYTESRSISAVISDFSIPSEGWTDSQDGSEYPYYLDVSVEGCRVDTFPAISLDKASQPTAKEAELSSSVLSQDGSVRLYAKKAPGSSLTGSLVLIANGGGGFQIPIASESTLGAVRIGKGLKVTPEGLLTPSDDNVDESDVAADSEVDELLKNEFGS